MESQRQTIQDLRKNVTRLCAAVGNYTDGYYSPGRLMDLAIEISDASDKLLDAHLVPVERLVEEDVEKIFPMLSYTHSKRIWKLYEHVPIGVSTTNSFLGKMLYGAQFSAFFNELFAVMNERLPQKLFFEYYQEIQNETSSLRGHDCIIYGTPRCTVYSGTRYNPTQHLLVMEDARSDITYAAKSRMIVTLMAMAQARLRNRGTHLPMYSLLVNMKDSHFCLYRLDGAGKWSFKVLTSTVMASENNAIEGVYLLASILKEASELAYHEKMTNVRAVDLFPANDERSTGDQEGVARIKKKVEELVKEFSDTEDDTNDTSTVKVNSSAVTDYGDTDSTHTEETLSDSDDETIVHHHGSQWEVVEPAIDPIPEW
ncbi:hypothetical protein N7492_008194 [Penicillium capsulatum]|uniref:Uncharacterized protein n=1 Tax=Penicillium capsulatum TaxID=69766 RepID=A0A9W9HT10_9EURO|nr:hypothetical protein N7492_008194 [Penicillium capsulatum]KAJ6105604.1 hypothetical protein N7512_009121 [Penicillium capsulatum]